MCDALHARPICQRAGVRVWGRFGAIADEAGVAGMGSALEWATCPAWQFSIEFSMVRLCNYVRWQQRVSMYTLCML